MLTTAEFETLAPMVDANQAFMRSAPNPRNPDTHPLPFPDVGNAETGKVEQYRLFHELPDVFYAYLSCDGKRVTTWTGDELGKSMWSAHSTWRNNFGAHCEAGRFEMNGATYSWRGPGNGMYVRCRKLKKR